LTRSRPHPARLLARLAPVLLLGPGCVLERFQDEPARLRPGIRIEVEGHGEGLLAKEIQEKEFDKYLEVTAPVAETPAGPEFLGTTVDVIRSADYENEGKEPVPAFPLRDGEWFKIKGDWKDDGVYHVRKVRRAEPLKAWELEGLITAADPAEEQAWVEVGPYHIEVTDRTSVELQDARREWHDFLDSTFLYRRATKKEKFPLSTIPVNDRMRIGGQFAVKYKRNDNADLNQRRDRDQDKIDSYFKFSTGVRVGEGGLLVGEGYVNQSFKLKEGDQNERDRGVLPTELFLFLPDVGAEGFHLQVGRQSIDEHREWLYDERLDAVRGYWERGRFQAEASVSRTPRVLDGRHPPGLTNLIGVLSFLPDEDWYLGAYVIDRRSNDIDAFSPFHYGLRSIAKYDAGLSHWLELSRADGIVANRRLQAWAVDGGVTLVADHERRPAVTLGYALGSGSRRTGDIDRTFRQTGLNDNNDKWSGVTSFRYYGEVFDPELSNLEVLTAGVGFRPTRRSSIDLVGHRYRQHVRRLGPLNSDLRAQANGRDAALGEELDLVIGYRGQEVTWEVVGGTLWPGDGFDRDANAYLLSFQIRYRF